VKGRERGDAGAGWGSGEVEPAGGRGGWRPEKMDGAWDLQRTEMELDGLLMVSRGLGSVFELAPGSFPSVFTSSVVMGSE
jgi:hypothetical protein